MALGQSLFFSSSVLHGSPGVRLSPGPSACQFSESRASRQPPCPVEGSSTQVSRLPCAAVLALSRDVWGLWSRL